MYALFVFFYSFEYAGIAVVKLVVDLAFRGRHVTFRLTSHPEVFPTSLRQPSPPPPSSS